MSVVEVTDSAETIKNLFPLYLFWLTYKSFLCKLGNFSETGDNVTKSQVHTSVRAVLLGLLMLLDDVGKFCCVLGRPPVT